MEYFTKVNDFKFNLGLFPRKEDVILISVIRNERLLLPYFINYYLNLGVTHFIFIDNDSNDSTFEYLENLKDINILLFKTNQSYSENDFGMTWVRKILDIYCINKYCLIVDIDELIVFKNNYNLEQMINKMKKTNSNVVFSCMIDFYPKNININYKSGCSFENYSPFYDIYKDNNYGFTNGSRKIKIKKIFCKKKIKIGTTLNGGMRKRVYNVTACLGKRSLIKYDFKEFELSVGCHWIIPKSDKSNEKNIKYYNDFSIIKHFKFIKPSLKSFFEERVERNQDWNNSEEYKNYLKNYKTTFFDNNVSKYFISNTELFKDFSGFKKKFKYK